MAKNSKKDTPNLDLSNAEKEIIVFKATWQAIGEMVNNAIMTINHRDPGSSIMFNTSSDRTYFGIILLSFLNDNIFGVEKNCLDGLSEISNAPGYLRRMLIDEHGNDKGTLKRGEHKSLQTDRVILVPGPDDEIKTVRWIYHCFVDKRMNETEIADHLNNQGIKTDLDREWTRSIVHQVLINEKYIGNNVFNRTSCKLKKRRVHNDPNMWVRAEGVFEAIIDTRYFYTAQAIIGERSRKLSDEELLSKLKDLHQRKGWLSGILIDEMEDMPSSSAYQSRFGSLIRAYQMIGYTPERDYSKYVGVWMTT